LAFEQNLTIIPVINKIDIIGADPERPKHQCPNFSIFHESDIISVSAKSGVGIHELLGTVIQQIPAPVGDDKASLKALLFDSWFDSYRGGCLTLPSKMALSKRVT